MRISIPKTQFIDFKFGQDNGHGREPVKILGEELHRFKRGGDRMHDDRNFTESGRLIFFSRITISKITRPSEH